MLKQRSLLLVTGICFLLASLPAAAQMNWPAPAPNSVSVMVGGEAKLKPDTTELLVDVAAQAPTLAEAFADAQAEIEEIKTVLGEAGVKPEDILVTGPSFALGGNPLAAMMGGGAAMLLPQAQPDAGAAPEGGAEMQTAQATVTIRLPLQQENLTASLKKADDVKAALAKAGYTVKALQFKALNVKEAEAALLADALKKVRPFAEDAAKAAGLKLGKVRSITVMDMGEMMSGLFGNAGPLGQVMQMVFGGAQAANPTEVSLNKVVVVDFNFEE